MNINDLILQMEDMDAVRINVARARAYSHAAHDAVGQKRKYTGESYWVHTDEVARTVHEDSMLTPDDQFDHRYMLNAYYRDMASLLHDILEDTRVTVEDLNREFGQDIASLVVELTDLYTSDAFPHMSRRDRKAAEAERLSTVSNNAKTVKLADLLSNTASIVAHDPNFAVIYLAEKAALLPNLKGGSPTLYARVEKQLAEAVEALRLRKS